jgi:hypothetical protein
MPCTGCSNSNSSVTVRQRLDEEIDALRRLLGAAPAMSFAETIAYWAPRFGPYLSQALQRFAAAVERGEATAERARELADRLRAARLPASVAAVSRLIRTTTSGERNEGSATRDALARCLAPLVALGGVSSVRGPRPFADALRRAAIIDTDEADVVFAVAKQFDRYGVRSYSTPIVLDELWSGAHTPAVLRRAVAHRARLRGVEAREYVLPQQRFGSDPVPLLTAGKIRIGLVGSRRSERTNEISIALDQPPNARLTEAYIWTDGMSTVGNARARQLAPWLVDEIAELS